MNGTFPIFWQSFTARREVGREQELAEVDDATARLAEQAEHLIHEHLGVPKDARVEASLSIFLVIEGKLEEQTV